MRHPVQKPLAHAAAGVLFAASLLLSIAPPAYAQGVTSAALSGTVLDDLGEPLPGANVIAVHQPTGTQYGAATRVDGGYTIPNMRAGGPYTITASFVGFQVAEEAGVTLTLGQTRKLDFVLTESAAVLEELEVLGERSSVLNSERTGASTNVDEQTIERLPTISRSLSDFARLSPLTASQGDGITVAGRSNRYNNIQIDGATLNDVFGLSDTGAPGGQAGTQPISLDAIAQFNVDIAPYDVRYNGFTGGSVNAITRSGTNAFTGSLRFLGRNETFVGDLETDRGQVTGFPEFSEYFVSGTFGGPIIRNELFFFANAEIVRENQPLVTELRGGTAGTIFDEAPETLDRIISIARDQYGYDPGGYGPITNEQNNVKLLLKLDWNLSDDHRLTLRNNYVSADDDDGVGRNDEEFDLTNRRYIFRNRQNSAVAELNSTFGANAFNEARLVYTRVRDERDVEAAPFPQVEILTDEERAVTLGIDRFSQANALDQDLYEFTNTFTYLAGDHTLTLGTSNQVFTFSNLFIQDYYGAYEFDGVDAFAAGQPARYFFSYSLLDEAQPRSEFAGYQLGFYAQDEWSPIADLALTFGLRMDVPIFPDEPLENQAALDAFGRSTANIASGNLLWSPRFGFNWSFGPDQSTQLRGGTGIFSGRTPYVWISNQYSNTGVDFGRVDARDLPDGFFVPSANPADQPRPGTAEGLEPIETTEINLVEDDFKFPQVWRTNVALDQQLPGGFVATLEGLYSDALNDIVVRNINLEQTGTSAYGRPIYGEARGFFGSPARLDPRFTNALLLDNTDEGYEYSLTAQLQREGGDAFNGSLSYTFTRAQSVNNGSSSRAISNWQFNENLDVNAPRPGTADYEVRHRVLAWGSYQFDWGDLFGVSANAFPLTASLVYDGRSGSPFSYIYVGDANADGQRFNDLVYVPAGPDEVVIENGTWEELDRFIESEPGLDEFRGEVVERNSARLAWTNRLDLNLTQGFRTGLGQQVELTANLFNVLNFLNADWGQQRFVQFDNVAIWDFEGYADDGRPAIEFDDGELDAIIEDREGELSRQSELASRWQLQLGVRLVF